MPSRMASRARAPRFSRRRTTGRTTHARSLRGQRERTRRARAGAQGEAEQCADRAAGALRRASQQREYRSVVHRRRVSPAQAAAATHGERARACARGVRSANIALIPFAFCVIPPPPHAQLKDLRSTIAREACKVLEILSEVTGDTMRPLVRELLPTLLELLASGNKVRENRSQRKAARGLGPPNRVRSQVIQGYIGDCMVTIIQHTRFRGLPYIIEQATTNKSEQSATRARARFSTPPPPLHSSRDLPHSFAVACESNRSKDVRDSCSYFVSQILSNWNPAFIEKDAEALQHGLKKCLEDSSAETRSFARGAFPIFQSHWPQRASQITQVSARESSGCARDMSSIRLACVACDRSSTREPLEC